MIIVVKQQADCVAAKIITIIIKADGGVLQFLQLCLHVVL